MAPGLKKPPKRTRTFGERFAIVLDHDDREHAIDEVLSSPSRRDPASIRVAGCALKGILREHDRSTAMSCHTIGVGFRNVGLNPRPSGEGKAGQRLNDGEVDP